MLIREITSAEKNDFNAVATHPLQSWEWGEFRQSMGLKVIRLGVFDDKKMVAGYQATVHPVGKTKYSILYLPKNALPDKSVIEALIKIGRENNSIFIKTEPEVQKNSGFSAIDQFFKDNGFISAKSIFAKYTLTIDLNRSEEELLANMHPKTRYNIRLAQKQGVKVVEDNSDKAFADYLNLHFETTKREGFYSHSHTFHQKMWEVLKTAGIAHLMIASFKGQPLTAWILFTFNNQLYYPYGGSSREHKEVMPSYAMMWEAMKFGQKNHCRTFDLWGIPGPDPDPKDPWYGFHRFKMGFGPKMVEYIGAYDLILNKPLYTLYNLADRARWLILRLKSRLPL